ncbi:spermidine synthase [soil metagenome]
MVPRVLLDTAQIPGDDSAELRLIQRGSDFSIMLGSNELMNSRLSGSEEELATLACARIKRARPRMLIGGLGMGFTLRKALAELPAEAEVEVAELVPAVVDWARGPLAHLHGDSLDDPRVHIFECDVSDRIRTARSDYDAILLDVDNGPDGLTRKSNNKLYSPTGLGFAEEALRPGGVLALWSAAPDPKFSRKLSDTGFRVEEVIVRAASGGKGARHIVWVATRPS